MFNNTRDWKIILFVQSPTPSHATPQHFPFFLSPENYPWYFVAFCRYCCHKQTSLTLYKSNKKGEKQQKLNIIIVLSVDPYLHRWQMMLVLQGIVGQWENYNPWIKQITNNPWS